MKRGGFVLLEVIMAVVIVSSLLLMINQAWIFKSAQQKRQGWLIDAEQVNLAATEYWAVNGVPPTTMLDLFNEEELTVLRVPWQQDWQFTPVDNWLELSVRAPSTAQALWFVKQIPGAFERGSEVVMPVWQPRPSIATNEDYLHRLEQADAPYLNTMATNLDMGQFDIVNVTNLDTQRLTADTVRTGELEATSLKTTELIVTTLYAQDVVTPTTSLQEVSNRLAEYIQLWKQCELQGKCS